MTTTRPTAATARTKQPTAHTLAAYERVLPVNENDIVEATLRACLALAPGFNAAIAAMVDERIRAEWGRENAYIPTAAGGAATRTAERNAAIMRDHAKGERVALLARRYSLTEKRIQQIIGH